MWRNILSTYEATKIIRSLDRPDAKKIPIYAMTANAFAEDVAAVLDAGMNGHIVRPIETKILYKILQLAFGGQEQNSDESGNK